MSISVNKQRVFPGYCLSYQKGSFQDISLAALINLLLSEPEKEEDVRQLNSCTVPILLCRAMLLSANRRERKGTGEPLTFRIWFRQRGLQGCISTSGKEESKGLKDE